MRQVHIPARFGHDQRRSCRHVLSSRFRRRFVRPRWRVDENGKRPRSRVEKLFDGFLKQRAVAIGEAFAAFDVDADYRRYVDGKPRHDGVRDFLASRGIELPFGIPQDSPGTPSVHGLGKLKDQYFAPIKLGITALRTRLSAAARAFSSSGVN